MDGTVSQIIVPFNRNRISDPNMIPVQLGMALGALGWGTRDLAKAAGVSLDTINRFRRGEKLLPRTVTAMRMAFEAAGIEFIEENGGGPGVRLALRSVGEARDG